MKKTAILLAATLAAAVLLIVGCGTPHMALFDVTGGGKTAINSGDTISFGTTYSYAPQTHNFKVENTGTGDLQLTGSGNKVVISGANPGSYSIPTQPPDKIPAGGSADFDIAFTGTFTFGSKSATIGVSSDDANLSSFSFNATGTDSGC